MGFPGVNLEGRVGIESASWVPGYERGKKREAKNPAKRSLRAGYRVIDGYFAAIGPIQPKSHPFGDGHLTPVCKE
ncbi:hypothetical protein CKO51_21905 [Rhodopirellula sp. SM50]|nr:hypothetical protein CKO51_21905 [Rhodopirellula sp. SM50]